ncbi:MAG: BsuBI/PstI family type II restriction endonuclease [Verrucomicrobia bacterium]|nr:BsuBI/PstI family type II restriction endonuclease [Verrucomicrobiota bacterium]
MTDQPVFSIIPNINCTADADLIEAVLTDLVPRWFPNSECLYAHTSDDQPTHFNEARFADLGIQLDAAAKMPDVVIHDVKRNWVILIEAVTSAGPVDGKRRSELKQLFKGSTAGLVFVTAFETRKAMQAFLGQISWESEVWIAEAPDHLIHFNGERFLGPYPDAMPKD